VVDRKEKFWLNWIPEIQYDLLARIPPGMILVLVLCWRLGITRRMMDLTGKMGDWSWGPSTLALIALFIVAYASAITISPVGIVLVWLVLQRCWQRAAEGLESAAARFYGESGIRARRVKDSPGKPRPVGPLTDLRSLPNLSLMHYFNLMHDKIKSEAPQFAPVVMKVRAEVFLAANTTVACTILCLFIGGHFILRAIDLLVPGAWASQGALLDELQYLIVAFLFTALLTSARI